MRAVDLRYSGPLVLVSALRVRGKEMAVSPVHVEHSGLFVMLNGTSFIMPVVELRDLMVIALVGSEGLHEHTFQRIYKRWAQENCQIVFFEEVAVN